MAHLLYLSCTALSLFLILSGSLVDDWEDHRIWMIILGVMVLLLGPFLFDLCRLCLVKCCCPFPEKMRANLHSFDHRVRAYGGRPPIIYDQYYNITACGVERWHPFDSTKYRRVVEYLEESELVTEADLCSPEDAGTRELLLVHSPLYLALLHHSSYVTKIVEVPICMLPSWLVIWRVVMRMRRATGGSILGSHLAMQRGWSINVGGGFHHAHAVSGSGFCMFADITLAICHLRISMNRPNLRSMIVDLDAHQGNGHERDFMDDENTFIIDMYNPYIFPGDQHAKRGIQCAVLVDERYDDAQYLNALRQSLTESLDAFKPEFLLYNAGTDCLEGDPLGGMSISASGIVARDAIVFAEAFARQIPILMVLSGGYQQCNAPIIGRSIATLIETFHLFDEDCTATERARLGRQYLESTPQRRSRVERKSSRGS